MIKFSITADVKALQRSLNDFAKKQLPFATRQAINAVGHEVVRDLRHEMRKSFDRPNNYTLNAFYLKPAKRNKDPEAWIGVREWSGSVPAWKYLTPEAFGGVRNLKRFEKALGTVMGGARFAVPGPGATLDANGNMSRSQIVQILSRLSAFGECGYGANMTDASRKRLMAKRKGAMLPARGQRSEYFIAHSKDGEPTGIYKLVGPGKVVAVLLFLKNAPTYTVRFQFEKTVQRSIAKHSGPMLQRALDNAMATARR